MCTSGEQGCVACRINVGEEGGTQTGKPLPETDCIAAGHAGRSHVGAPHRHPIGEHFSNNVVTFPYNDVSSRQCAFILK